MFFFILGHIETENGRVVLEQEFSKRLGKFRLSSSCRAKEEETAYGLSFLIQSGTGFIDGIKHSLDCMVLTYHPFLEYFLGIYEPVTLGSLYITQRYSGLLRYDFHQMFGSHRLCFRFRMQIVLDFKQ